MGPGLVPLARFACERRRDDAASCFAYFPFSFKSS